MVLLAACVPVEDGTSGTPPAGIPSPAASRASPAAGTPRAGPPPPTCVPTTPFPGIVTTPTPLGRLCSPPVVATPVSSRPLPFRRDERLESLLRAAVGGEEAFYGIVVKNLQDGTGAALNADQVFYAASLFKIEVMFEVFHQRGLGILSFDERLEVTPYYATFDLGTLPVEVGQSLSIAEALAYMMSLSDNTSAVLLQDRVGAGNINRSLEALGLTDSGLFPDDLPATAGDVALLLEAIAAGKTVGEDARREMLELLATETTDNGIRGGLPEGVTVAHKTGIWPNARHDAGIVFTPGATYVIVVLSDGDASRKIREVSRVVYEHYNGRR